MGKSRRVKGLPSETSLKIRGIVKKEKITRSQRKVYRKFLSRAVRLCKVYRANLSFRASYKKSQDVSLSIYPRGHLGTGLWGGRQKRVLRNTIEN